MILSRVKIKKVFKIFIGIFLLSVFLFYYRATFSFVNIYYESFQESVSLDYTNQMLFQNISHDSWNDVLRNDLVLWPDELKKDKQINRGFDRIVGQLRYVPSNSNENIIKKLYLINNDQPPGFNEPKCAENRCVNTNNQRDADLIMFRSNPTQVQPNASYIYWELESVENSMKNTFEYTEFSATYRWDSDIVLPYFKYVPYSFEDIKKMTPYEEVLKFNFAKGKKNSAIWLVSNCHSTYRNKFVWQLKKYFQVDIYGRCANKSCGESKDCMETIKGYKFYLAFENSICRDYITEKFSKNSLDNRVVPVVLGARLEDYERAAPPHSFIHVDQFATVKALADYLKMLSKDDFKYNQYFSWHDHWVSINARSWCRLCLLAHHIENIRKARKSMNPYKINPNWWNDNQCKHDAGWVEGRPSDLL